MILADKIIQLRKKYGLTQEAFAEKMDVSRQAVSKWESAQSVPDLNKILQMSELFGVSTDALLKDDLIPEGLDGPADGGDDVTFVPARRVSMEEANAFLAMRRHVAYRIASGVFLCILALITLIIASAGGESGYLPFSEQAGVAIGLSGAAVLAAIAVALFVTAGQKGVHLDFIRHEPIEPEYGVDGVVRKQEADYRSTYFLKNVIGIVLCILALIPIFLAVLFNEEQEFYAVLMVCGAFFLAGIGVFILVSNGIIQASFQSLQDRRFRFLATERDVVTDSVRSIFSTLVLVIFLVWGFIGNAWRIAWIVWPISAVLYPIIPQVIALFRRKRKGD